LDERWCWWGFCLRGGVVDRYRGLTAGSGRVFERARRCMAGGVHHNIRFFEPYPLVAVRGRGAYLWDVDGNRFTDYWMGHMALILGHSPEPVVAAVREQLEAGTHLGTVTLQSIELVERVCRLVPCAEMVRLCNTGAEATMYAVRLARGFTGRRVVVKVEGGWHGYSDTLLKAATAPFNMAESLGMVGEALRYVRTVRFNDLEGTLRVLREVGSDLAAMVLEPVLGGAGAVPADREYLKAVQEEVERLGGLLIFDEIISGFRVALGGAQEYFGIKPDLCTLGKILGGGFPIGAVCGRRDVLELASPDKAKGERVWIGGGTFSGNPISMVAGRALLDFLEAHREEVYGRLAEMGDRARRAIDRALADVGVRARSTGVGSLLLTHFLVEGQEEIREKRDAARADREAQHLYYLALMADHQIFFLPGHTGAISYAHTPKDIEALVEASAEAGRVVKAQRDERG
jgi:glutamate-1-semialdehyde 2,1-aminomutase